MNFSTLIARFENLKIEEVVVKSIQETEFDIEELNREQLLKGLKSDGEQIKNIKTGSTSYSKAWAEHRIERGLQVNHYDLRFEGPFQAGIEVENVNASSFQINDDDSKYDDLVDLFGYRILGLNADSKSKYKDVLQPVLIGNLKTELSL